MRSFTITVLVAIALATVYVGNVHAVGLYAVGKEECNCSTLVARGIVPDTLNKLHEALLLPQLAMILDKIAVGIKDMVAQTGGPSAVAPEEEIKRGEEAQELKEKPSGEKKPGKEEISPKEEKPAIEKKSIKKKKPSVQLKKDAGKKKKRPVKMPPKVTKSTIS
jgi:hypothetical protein